MALTGEVPKERREIGKDRQTAAPPPPETLGRLLLSCDCSAANSLSCRATCCPRHFLLLAALICNGIMREKKKMSNMGRKKNGGKARVKDDQ